MEPEIQWFVFALGGGDHRVVHIGLLLAPCAAVAECPEADRLNCADRWRGDETVRGVGFCERVIAIEHDVKVAGARFETGESRFVLESSDGSAVKLGQRKMFLGAKRRPLGRDG